MRSTIALLMLVFLAACFGTNKAVTGQATPVVAHTAVSQPPLTPTAGPTAGIFYAIELSRQQQLLVEIDATSGLSRTRFEVPVNGWLASFDLLDSFGSEQFVLAYAPPPPAGKINFGFTGLYQMAVDETEPHPLLLPKEQELFFNPVWSADGQFIYFSHVTPLDPEKYTFTTTLERLHLATGQIDVIAENGLWPQLSPDGRLLAYVYVTPQTQMNVLMLAAPDGSNARELMDGQRFTAVDAPIFSPDSQMLYFSAAPPANTRSWWHILTGVHTAVAHNIPSDWYRMPVAGGEIERLTQMDAVGLYGRFAPHDVSVFAFASQEGLYIMALDGENIQQLRSGTFTDSLAWIIK